MFVLGYIFFCLVVITVYSANLTAFMTVNSLQSAVSGLKDIKTQGVSFGINGGGNTENYFRKNTDPLIQSLIPYMKVYA